MKTTARLIIVSTLLVIAAEVFATNPTSVPDRLIAALIQVESNGNDKAIGDRHLREKAYGPLQVRQPCVDDVNQRYGTKIKASELHGNRALSIWVCHKYIELYATPKRLGRNPTLEDMSRIWNGGPTGHKRPTTLQYWSKVSKKLK